MSVFHPIGFRKKYEVGAAVFDGTNDYLTRGADLSGSADGKSGTLSAWLRLDGGNGSSLRIFENTGPAFRLQRQTTNVLSVIALVTGPSDILRIDSDVTVMAGATWRHLLASWDLAAGVAHMMLDGVDVSDLQTMVDNTIDYTVVNWSLGATTAGGNKLPGALAEWWFAQNVYMNVTQLSILRAFRDAQGRPTRLGADGSRTTGVIPIVYHHLDKGEAVANFALNRGSGGNMTVNGALGASASSPSDS